ALVEVLHLDRGEPRRADAVAELAGAVGPPAADGLVDEGGAGVTWPGAQRGDERCRHRGAVGVREALEVVVNGVRSVVVEADRRDGAGANAPDATGAELARAVVAPAACAVVGH